MGLCDHTAKLKLGGKDREVRLNFVAVQEFEVAYGKSITAFAGGGTSVSGYAKLIAICMKQAGAKVTEHKILQWFGAEPGAFGAACDKMQELLVAFWKESHGVDGEEAKDDEDVDQDPPAPAAAGSTGTL